MRGKAVMTKSQLTIVMSTRLLSELLTGNEPLAIKEYSKPSYYAINSFREIIA